jgi:hypothetical protein
MQFTTYDDVRLHGLIGPYEFHVISTKPDLVTLQVGLDGAWTTTCHATVGQALRELAREIGEG